MFEFPKQNTNDIYIHPSTSHFMLSLNDPEHGSFKQIRVLSFVLKPQVFEQEDQFVHSSYP